MFIWSNNTINNNKHLNNVSDLNNHKNKNKSKNKNNNNKNKNNNNNSNNNNNLRSEETHKILPLFEVQKHTSLAWAAHVFIMVYSARALAVRKDTFRQFFNISTSARPKVLGTPHVLKIRTSKCAFRHSGVQFFASVF